METWWKERKGERGRASVNSLFRKKKGGDGGRNKPEGNFWGGCCEQMERFEG
jgi:hypothetical protein